MRHTRGLALVPATLALTLTLAACGSTVQVGDEQALGGQTSTQSGDSLGAPLAPGATAPGSDAAGGTGGPGSTGSGGGVPASGAGAGTTTDTAGTGTTPGGGSGGIAGVGDSGVIQVGIPYTADGGAANAAIGASGITTGDVKAGAQAMVDEINATGGVLGRKVKPVYFAYDAQSSQTVAQQDQNACSHYTEDNHIAVLLGGGLTEVMDKCMLDHGVLQITSGSLIGSAKSYHQRYPNLIQAGTISQDRMYADQATTLKRLGYFSKWDTRLGQAGGVSDAKVGVLVLDDPNFTAPLKSVFLPRLESLGYSVDSSNIYAVRPPGGTNELAGTIADVQNAGLRFAQSGVTHVVIFDVNATMTLFFLQNTNNQRYYPRLGVNSPTGIQALYTTGVATNQQLNGAVGLGWLPSIDLSEAAGRSYQTAATKHCLAVHKKRTGQTYTSTNAASIALSQCDSAFLMQQGLNLVKGNLTLSSAIGAIESVRGGYASALIPSSYFGPGRHDAAQLGFDMKWDTGCSCTKYVGKHTIP